VDNGNDTDNGDIQLDMEKNYKNYFDCVYTSSKIFSW